MADAPVDAQPPPPHVGGWRMVDHDTSNANHADIAGPPPLGTNKLLYEEPGAHLGTPVIDELGNLYLTSSGPNRPEALLSLTPAGVVRWRTPLADGAFLAQLSLGPDGNVHAISATSADPSVARQIVVFDAATGTALPGSAPIVGLSRLRLPPDRRIYTATFVDSADSGIQMRTALDAAPVWSVARGGGATFALSPDGATLVLSDLPPGASPAAYDIIALDAATGAQRWHHALDPALDQAPPIAIDADGTVYVASSGDGGNLHVIALSPDGAVVWDHAEPFQAIPSRILIGRATVTVATLGPEASFATGITVQKSDGTPTTTTVPCGDPQAIDRDDHIYWVCDEGILSADSAGTSVGQWHGRHPLGLVLGGTGTAYQIPSALGTDFQLFSIELDLAPTPPPDLVHVQVFSTTTGLPAAGVRVLFAAPNDALIADAQTDAQGQAAAAMAAGYVTVQRHGGNFDTLTTVLGVKAGDSLLFGPAADDRTSLGTATVTVPPGAGNEPPLLYTPCVRQFVQTGANPVPVDANPACREHVGLLARADGVSLFSYLADQELTAGGALAMPAWQPTVTTQYTLSSFPANIDLQASLSLFPPIGEYAEQRTEPVFAVETTQTFDHADVGDSLMLVGGITRTDDSTTSPQIGRQAFYVRTPAAPAISLATPGIRWLFRPAIDPHGPSPRLIWTQDGTDSTTLGWLSLSYNNPGDSQNSTGGYQWDVVGPVLGPGIANMQTLGLYTLPQLPDPRLRLSVFGQPGQAFVRAIAVNPEVGYDQLRPVLAREIDFEAGQAGLDGEFVDLRHLLTLPGATDVRFSSSRVGTSVTQ